MSKLPLFAAKYSAYYEEQWYIIHIHVVNKKEPKKVEITYRLSDINIWSGKQSFDNLGVAIFGSLSKRG